MSLQFFGTDGIRGPYGSETLNDAIAYRAGRAAVQVAQQSLQVPEPVILAGRDTRESGKRLLRAFANGVLKAGGKVLDLGVAPTPCVAFAARTGDAHLACAITASHNPAADNGIKFFLGDGVKLSEELEQALDDAIGKVDTQGLDGPDLDGLQPVEGSKRSYADAVIRFFPANALAGKRIALDCANGAMFEIAPEVFRALGAEVDVIANTPNGLNINDEVGSEHPESLRVLYSEKKYDMGFAFDGDGDRVMLSDENGRRLLGEAVLAALAIDAFETGELVANTLVTTIQSNLGLDAVLAERGISVARTDVGDKHVARLMKGEGYSLGGEESGHLVLGRFAITGDGLFAAVKIAELIARTGKSVSETMSVYRPFPEAYQSLDIAEKRPIEKCPSLFSCIQNLRHSLGNAGRVLVRYSGTEPKIRLLVEARDDATTEVAMRQLLAAVNKDLELL